MGALGFAAPMWRWVRQMHRTPRWVRRMHPTPHWGRIGGGERAGCEGPLEGIQVRDGVPHGLVRVVRGTLRDSESVKVALTAVAEPRAAAARGQK
ncbi:hypothetical protein GCM10009565_07130 [Amycolatopsis albidoflavus]